MKKMVLQPSIGGLFAGLQRTSLQGIGRGLSNLVVQTPHARGDGETPIPSMDVINKVSAAVNAAQDAVEKSVAAGDAANVAQAFAEGLVYTGPSSPDGGKGKLWFMTDASGRVKGMYRWDDASKTWKRYSMIAGEILVPGSVGAVQIADGAVTAKKVQATAIDGMTITGAVVRTAESGARTELAGSGLRVVDADGNDTIRIGQGVTTGMSVRQPGGALVPLGSAVFGTQSVSKEQLLRVGVPWGSTRVLLEQNWATVPKLSLTFTPWASQILISAGIRTSLDFAWTNSATEKYGAISLEVSQKIVGTWGTSGRRETPEKKMSTDVRSNQTNPGGGQKTNFSSKVEDGSYLWTVTPGVPLKIEMQNYLVAWTEFGNYPTEWNVANLNDAWITVQQIG